MNLHFEEDIVLAKVSTIRKAVATIRSLDSELPGAEKEWVRLDLTVLNLQRAVEAAIDVANTHLARVEQIKKFTVIAGDWLPGGDELTPTIKLKRKPIAAKYTAEIDAMYAN